MIWCGRLLGLAVLGLTGCAVVVATTPDRRADTAAPRVDEAAWESLLADARSADRRCGREAFQSAPAMTEDQALRDVARQHSRDMADSGQLGHTGRGGETLSDRIAASGVSARAWAENVAAGQADAGAAVAAWLASPGHCSNIMRAEFESFGAAVAHADDGTRYWTLVLVAPAD